MGAGQLLDVGDVRAAHHDLAAEPLDLLHHQRQLEPLVDGDRRGGEGGTEGGGAAVLAAGVVGQLADRRRGGQQVGDAQDLLDLERGLEGDLARHHRAAADLLRGAGGDQRDGVPVLEQAERQRGAGRARTDDGHRHGVGSRRRHAGP